VRKGPAACCCYVEVPRRLVAVVRQLWITEDKPTERLLLMSEAQFGRALAIGHGVPT